MDLMECTDLDLLPYAEHVDSCDECNEVWSEKMPPSLGAILVKECLWNLMTGRLEPVLLLEVGQS